MREINCLFVALLLSILLGCQKYQPEKPKNISLNAIWVAGSDGGMWVDCVISTDNSYNCLINLENGDLHFNGIFVKIGKNKTDATDNEHFSAVANINQNDKLCVAILTTGRAYLIQKKC
jgi:hypothetical protein